jgi:hypothetical protein
MRAADHAGISTIANTMTGWIRLAPGSPPKQKGAP